jgi:hypothetical protein
MRKILTTLLAATTLFSVMVLPASATEEDNFVDFVAEQADQRRGQFNVISNVVLALAEGGLLTSDDLAALSSAEITAFLPTDVGMRRLAADLEGKRWWQIRESQVIPKLVDALGLETIAEVVKYHVYAGGKVDYRTALSLDDNRRNGTDTFIEMYNGGDLGIDRRGWSLQLDDAGDAGLGTNNPFVVRRNIDAGNALVHGISEVLLP